EEFLVVLPGIDLSGAREIAERLRETVAALRPAGVHVTISCGLSAGVGEEVDYDTLFRAADESLYAAKRAGRDRVGPAAPAPGQPQVDDAPGVSPAPRAAAPA